jgi:glycosyltransferase 2 family protein
LANRSFNREFYLRIKAYFSLLGKLLVKKQLKRYFGYAVSLVFIYFIIFRSGISYKQLVKCIKDVSALDIFILVILYLIPYPLRAIRGVKLLPKLDFHTSLGGIFVGYGANNLLPLRLGEVVRAQVVGKYSNELRSTVLSSIVIERIFDGFAIVILLLIGAWSLELPEWALKARFFGLTLFTLALLGLIFIGFFKEFFGRIIDKTCTSLNRELRIVKGLFEGITIATRSVSIVLQVLALSFLIWGLEGFVYYYGFKVFNFDCSFLNALFVLGVLNLGVLIPSSPGYVGVFEFFTSKSLSIFGVANTPAIAYSLLLHSVQYFPITIIGCCYFYKFGIAPKDLAENLED